MQLIGKLSTTTNKIPSNTLGGLGSMINLTKRLALVFFLAALSAQAARAITVDTLTTNDTTPTITGTLATGDGLVGVTVNGVATNTPVIDNSVTPNTWRAQVAVLNALNEGTYAVVATIFAGGIVSATNATLTIDTTTPTATLAYTYGTGTNTATRVSQGTSITITATFNEDMALLPVPQITGTGAHTVSATDMTRVDATSYTYAWTVGANDGTQTFTLSDGTDLAGNTITATPVSGASIIVDNTAPTATLAYTYGASTNTATRVKAGDSITITAAFSESMKGSPAMRIAGTGAHTVSATNMTRVNATSYTYAWTVGTGDGTQTFTLSQGQDLTGNTVTATPTSGASITVDNTAPTNQNTVFATSRAVAGSATVPIISSGVASNSVWFAPATTTNFSASSTITRAASGTATSITAPATAGDYKLFVQDSVGNVSSPSTATLTVDNLSPITILTYAYGTSTNTATRVSQGTSITITADFNEDIALFPIPQITGTGAHTVSAANMTRVDATSYTYVWTVGTGDGTQTFTLSDGTDLAGNTITATPVSGASIIVDNTAPTATLAYTYGTSTNTATQVNQGTNITITAAFSESMKGSPAMRIAGTGAHTVSAATMTRVNATTYTYAWTVGTGDGTQTFTLSQGQDLTGNTVTATPTSGASITVDNLSPSNQNTVFNSNIRAVAGSATVPIISSGVASNSVWFAPTGTTNFVAGNTITRATGTATSIAAPATAGDYKLFVQDSAGNVSSPSTASLSVDTQAPTNQNTVFATSRAVAGSATVPIDKLGRCK